MKINWQIVGWSVGGVAVAAAVATAAAIGPIWAPQTSTTEDTGVYLIEPAAPAVESTATPTPTAAPAPVAETVAPAPPPALIKCPAGTDATHVDDAGNESGCIAQNDQGESCQAFNDAGECTAWASLDTRRIESTL